MKKYVLLAAAIATLCATVAIAEDQPAPAAPAPVLPKGSYSLTQWMDVESVNGGINGADFTTNAPIDESTQIKGNVAFDLGGGLRLNTYMIDRLQDKFNTGDLYSKLYSNGEVTAAASPTLSYKEYLGSIGIRNRFSAGLGITVPVTSTLSVGGDFVYRNAFYLKTGTSFTNDGTTLPTCEQRLAPTVCVNGSIGSLYINAWQGLYYYLDPTTGNSGSANAASGTTGGVDNTQDNSFWETEGFHVIGYSIPLSDYVTLKFQVDNYLDIYNMFINKYALSCGGRAYYSFTENPDLRAIVSVGDIAPFIGPFWTWNSYDQTGNFAEGSNVVGAIFGSDINVSKNVFFNVTVNAGWQIGYSPYVSTKDPINSPSTNCYGTYATANGQFETEVQATLTIKG